MGCSQADELFGKRNADATQAAPTVPPAANAGLDPAAAAPSGQTTAQILALPDGNAALTNLAQLLEQTQVTPYHKAGQHGQQLTIAILDNGFAGLNNSLGKRLPPTTQLLKPALDQMENTIHGTKMAEIVYAIASGQAAYSPSAPGPKLLLLNTDGFSNLHNAVSQAIAAKVDIALYAQVWQYGDNFDGQGFINAEVNRATAAGIVWINAAGNLGASTFNGPVKAASDGVSVDLPFEHRFVRFTVPKDQTVITAVLSWNDYANSTDMASRQDLDLILEDPYTHVIASSRLHQSGKPVAGDQLYSAYPREILDKVTLNTGVFYARIEDQSHNFNANARLRLSIDGDGVTLLDKSGGSTLGVPADNPTVITVGASDVTYGSTSADSTSKPTKPEVSTVSSVIFADGEQHNGTSSASAILVGKLAAMSASVGPLTRAKVLELIKAGKL